MRRFWKSKARAAGLARDEVGGNTAQKWNDNGVGDAAAHTAPANVVSGQRGDNPMMVRRGGHSLTLICVSLRGRLRKPIVAEEVARPLPQAREASLMKGSVS